MTAPRQRFRVHLEAPADDVPAAIRLRRFLKMACGRSILRCTGIVQTPDAVAEAAPTMPKEHP